MPATCQLCGTAIDAGAPVFRLAAEEAVPRISETRFNPGRDGALAYFCDAHVEVLRPLAGPAGDAIESELRGRLYQELDLLAFAFEMETHEAIERGDEAAAARAQQTRLGVRLAARLVGGVPAPEVNERLNRWREEYRSKFPT